jgi:predicted MFS family arabinose efflux permease
MAEHAEDTSRDAARRGVLGRAYAAVIAPYREIVREGRGRSTYRGRFVLIGAAVIAVDFADRAAIGALAPDLKHAFGLSNTQIGLLASVFSILGALGTIPAGVLVDRVCRTRLLAGGIALWSAAMAACGAATSFVILLGARACLGAITAVARPAVASMSGDTFPPRLRGRALSLIDTGELAGNGAGFLLAGVVAAVLSWRSVFFALGIAGLALAWLVLRLREPERGGATRSEAEAGEGLVQQLAEEADDVEPDEELVLEGDQSQRSLPDSVRYVLRVRANVVVFLSMAIGSFFFAGVRTFGIVFAVHAYGIGRSVADIALLGVGIGGLVGVLAGGRIGDLLVQRGLLNGRLVVASYSYIVAAAAFVPALLVHSLAAALPLFVVAGAALVAPSAPLDAVRLDVIHPQLWGRAEGIRNVLQIGAEAGAPVLFGLLSDTLAGGGQAGLRLTFVIGAGTLVASGLMLQLARRYYPAEVAAATESIRDS